jgi:DNA mismatch repair ATPase MutS
MTHHQYPTLKALHPGALLLFPNARAYVLLHEDAVEAAPLLGLGLTPYGGSWATSFSEDALGANLARLAAAGRRVEVCEVVGGGAEGREGADG